MKIDLPIEYHIEIYVDSWLDDPAIAWKSDKPFPALSVGDYFEHRTAGDWLIRPAENQRFKIKEIDHILWAIDDSHIAHKLMVLLEIVEDTRFKPPR